MPDREPVDLIFSDEGEFGWTVRSPQVPGLIAARDTLKELSADLPGLLEFAGVDLSAVERRPHIEKVISVPEGDLVVRIAGDKHRQEREATANRIVAALAVQDQRPGLLSVPRTLSGEVLYVCVVPSDTVRWLTDQFGPSGDAAAVAMNVAEEMIWATHFVAGPPADATDDALSLADLGFSMETTMGEMMRESSGRSSPRRLILSV
ncbi:hypothetical protein [Micromonospora sp. URMC 103]|uniref:hypothetical protein n=1 Tax=Micromonospora sp. URMC 103 TaxID=3423406 RepID=UPI003F1A6CA9